MSTEQQDVMAEAWDGEVEEKAADELGSSEFIVRRILDKEGLEGRKRMVRGLALFGEVFGHLDSAIANNTIDLTLLQQGAETIQDPLLREAVVASGRLFDRIQRETTVTPGFRKSYLMGPFERAALPPMQSSSAK